ncbi:2960_t:CDS:2 [Rhizophagus irregularis]|nr:2960_t:CDS:2 [Rhizophagus irregularis]
MNSISIDVEDTKSSDLVDGDDEHDISEFSEKELNKFIEDYKKIIAAGKKVSIIIAIGDDSTNEKTKSKRLKQDFIAVYRLNQININYIGTFYCNFNAAVAYWLENIIPGLYF